MLTEIIKLTFLFQKTFTKQIASIEEPELPALFVRAMREFSDTISLGTKWEAKLPSTVRNFLHCLVH